MGLLAMGTYFQFQSSGHDLSNLSWVLLTSFSYTMFLANWGLTTLTFLVIAEIFPEKLRDYGVLFCNAFLSTTAFFVTKFLPILTEVLGTDGCMFLFAFVCLLGSVFIIFVMPETKGKSHGEIMKMLQ